MNFANAVIIHFCRFIRLTVRVGNKRMKTTPSSPFAVCVGSLNGVCAVWCDKGVNLFIGMDFLFTVRRAYRAARAADQTPPLLLYIYMALWHIVMAK